MYTVLLCGLSGRLRSNAASRQASSHIWILGAREIGAGRQAVTGASSLATGPASALNCVDTYGHRSQASSPIGSQCLS